MKNIFIISGYGVPTNIFKDVNYNFYLKMVFNRVWDIVATNNLIAPVVVFTGGPTDMVKPYKRTEAGEMLKLFKSLTKPTEVRKQTKDWFYLTENHSITGLENFLFTNKLLNSKKIKKGNIFYFCEHVRAKRNKILLKLIFNRNFKTKLIPLDFDMSINRYLDPDFLQEKERKMISVETWALKKKTNLNIYHKAYKKRIIKMRKVGIAKHLEEINRWWVEELEELYQQSKK